MTTTDPAIQEFVRLLDIAIAIAENMKINSANSIIREAADRTINIMKSFRDKAINGQLPRPSKGQVPMGTGLGLTRGVGEWTEDDDLLDAVYAAENHYKTM